MKHTIYDFFNRKFTYNEQMSPERNAAYLGLCEANANLKIDVTAPTGNIAGTRTSATRFTRTAGTFDLDADVGKYVLAYKSNDTDVWSWHKISAVEDPAEGYLDISTAYGNVALGAGIDNIIVFTTNETESMASAEALVSFVKV